MNNLHIVEGCISRILLFLYVCMNCFCKSIDRKDISWHQCIFHYFHFPKDNSKQMSKLCPTCTSVCDLCPNGLYWEQDSRFGLYDAALVQGICTTRTIPFLMYCLLSCIFILMKTKTKQTPFLLSYNNPHN